jgi:hypothetical protein
MPEPAPDPFGLSAVGQRCFCCGSLLRDPAIHWSGFQGEGSGNIYLHHQCALQWMPGLLRDVQEVKTREKRQRSSEVEPS